MLIELVVGLWANALVLIADAGHMFLDAAALGLAWWAAVVSQRGEDESLSYGYHRFQVLAAFINGLTLAALVCWIIFEAVERFMQPQSMLPIPTLAVAVVGFVINLLAFSWLHNTSGNTNIRSAALHVLGDLLGSGAAIIAALSVLFLDWHLADPILALLIAAILGRGAYRVLKESSHILLEGVPHGVDLDEIKQYLCQQVPNIVGVHHVHAWALTAEKPLVTLHAQIEENTGVDQVVSDIKQILCDRFGIAHSTIQIELDECPDNPNH